MNLLKNPAWTVTGILATSLIVSAILLPAGEMNPATAADRTNLPARTTAANGSGSTGGNTETNSSSLSSSAEATISVGGIKIPVTANPSRKQGRPRHSIFPTISPMLTPGSTPTISPTTSNPTGTSTPTSSPTTTTPTNNPTTTTPTTSPAITTPTNSPTTNPTTQTPTTTPTNTPTTNPNAMPTGNQSGWTQTYAEDFNKTTPLGQLSSIYGKNLFGYNGFTDTSGNGTYTPNSVLSTSNGNLDYYIHYAGGKYLTAAPMPQGSTGQTYGKYSMRFRADNIPGYKIAFLLWPDSGKWTDGEIDFPEADLGSQIYAYSHDVTGNPSHNTFAWNTSKTTTDWHTLTLEWTPTHLTYTIDGISKTTTDKTAIPTKPMHLVLQAETALNGIKPSTSAAGHIQIDWLTIYKYNG